MAQTATGQMHFLSPNQHCQSTETEGKYSPKKVCDGAQMAIFGDFFASCVFTEPRAADFRPAS